MTACLLEPGTHRIVPNMLLEGLTCGLLPIGGRVDSVTTTGLKWDLTSQALEFGGLVRYAEGI